MTAIKAALFDKDGTLIDFHRTWDRAIGHALRGAAVDDEHLTKAAALLEFDLRTNSISASSPLIADSNDQVLALLESVVDTTRFIRLVERYSLEELAPAIGLPDALHQLAAREIALAVVTNDYESMTSAQLRQLGWHPLFAHIIGSDSGFGAKPDPDIVIGALGLCGVDPTEAVLIGDTTHDLIAGRDAGVRTVLVTNSGEPSREALQLADHTITTMAALVPTLTEAGLLR